MEILSSDKGFRRGYRDVCYVERRMFELQCSLANHCWVSFSGWSVAYNEAFDLLNRSKDLLSEKNVANTFWNGELEAELRERGALDLFGMFHKLSDREVVMQHVDELRAKTVYAHAPEDCTRDCKARGCGKLWVADGQWKLMFPHCIAKRKNVVNGLPLLNYPDVCTSAPVHGKAFCQEHMDFIAANHPSIPTDIRGFLKHCGVLKADEDCETNVENDVTLSRNEIEKVEAVVKGIAESTAGATIGQSTIVSQGNEELFSRTDCTVLLSDCVEASPTSCNKETGEKQRLQKWSRGHFFIVRGSGIIDKWNPIFRSESPSQAFIIILNWLFVILNGMLPASWGELYLAYDNMCHVDGLRVARKALPFPAPFNEMWLKINKLIDSLHIANHKDEGCRTKYDPAKLKKDLPDMNTMAAEQTFVWLSRFKKILCSMPKIHHLFFMHRMVMRRNNYTVSCYKRGLKPVLPKARSAHNK